MAVRLPADATEEATPAEVAAGRLSDDKVGRLAAHIREHGFAVLTGPVIPTAVLDQLGPRFEFDAAWRYLDALEAGGGSSVPLFSGSIIPGHGSARLPRSAPWVHAEIVANPLVEQVVAAALGPQPYLNVYGGNLSFPGSGTQELHMDGVWQYPSKEAAAAAGVEWPPPPHQLIAQICPTGSTSEDATEVWPGSHLVTELASANKFTDGATTQELYRQAGAARIDEHPPVRLEIPVGAVGFRDNRLFHRGVPNRGDAPRPMLALQYASNAVRDDLVANSTKLRSRLAPNQKLTDNLGQEVEDEARHVTFSEDCRSVFETPSPFGVDRNAEFLPGPLDWDGKPGHLPTELPEVQPGVELPVWLQRYIAREQSESQGAQRAAL
jgi:hypothetical protein